MESKSVWKGLLYGSCASMIGDIVTMPVDVTKTRLQLSGMGGKTVYSGFFDCLVGTAKAEGVSALWKGIEPAMWRQFSYGGLRYGLYAPIKNIVAPEGTDLTLTKKIFAGGMSGTIAQAVANPCDLVKIRMQADGMGGSAPRYRWFLGALATIAKEDGVAGLYKGLSANVGRASTLAAAEMASYDTLKPIMADNFSLEGLPLHFATANGAGFIAAFVANPFDVAKSRLMNGGAEYSGMVDCMTRTAKNEGVAALWKGFIPAWARVGPRVVIAFVVMEQLKEKFG
jgi:solute carrier family 25 uncoupling protein 8/9